MAPSEDPHKGGDLNDMAVSGTSMPNDAGKMRLIPSVPRPDQMTDEITAGGGLGAPTAAAAADNATDIPRSVKDMGQSGEVITGTGDQMPAESQTKHLHYGGGDGLAKGSERYDKHTRDKEGAFDRFAGSGAEMQAAPGEEGNTQDEIRDRKQG